MTNFLQITGLALADSVNPCEIAILAMILVSILVKNPGKKKKVLFAGLAFVAAVFIGYMVYGLVIIQFFKIIAQVLRENSIWIYNILAAISMVMGSFHIRDFFFYKKGGFTTEMPLFLRPKAKKITEKITSTGGAFVLGFLLTLFLLPCTMGPYVIASGLLSELGILGALPWLLYYNIVFVLPMLAIVLIIYFGFAKVDEVTGWKDKHIRILHLVAGVLLFLVGLAILMRWI